MTPSVTGRRPPAASVWRRGVTLWLVGTLLALVGPAHAQPARPGPPPAAAIAAPAAAVAAQPPQAPVLRVEAGTHIAPVRRLAVDASGRLLATVSDDKTLRLWSLPDGAARGVLRPPIGLEAEGELYAVALSPDGSRAFAAGHTARAWDGAFAIYVFDTASGRLAARLPGLPAPVNALAVSADGERLAAGFAGRGGVRVWDARTGRMEWEDMATGGFAGAVRGLVFDARQGRLAATGADGRVRLYDATGRKLAERAPLAGARPYGVAFSPDGTLLAIGYEDRLRVDLLAVGDLRTVFSPDVGGLTGEGLAAVGWATDGRGGVQLHAAGYARAGTPRAGETAPRSFVIRRWADFGLGASTDIPAARDAIGELLALPSPIGGLVYAAADPGWGRIAADGTLARAPVPAALAPRAVGRSLAIAPDGTRLRFDGGAGTLVFDAGIGRLSPAEADAGGLFLPPRVTAARLAVQDWRDTNRPRLGQAALRLDPGEFSRSLAILSGEDGFVLGTDTHLRRYDAAGRLLEAVPLPGAAWGLAVAANGVMAAALGDGTLRWYGPDPGGRLAERAALFVHADARRWVLWTPEGLFDHAPEGGQELVGVHLNRGRAQTPEWASFRQAYRALYAPTELRARLQGDPGPAAGRIAALGDMREAIGRLPIVSAQHACATLPDGSCRTLALTPAVTVPPESIGLRLTLRAEDRGLGLGPVDALVNDRMAARGTPPRLKDAPTTRGDGAASAELVIEVPLDPGPNRVSTRLYAEDRVLFAEGPAFELRREGERAPPAETGRLLVLAVGVDRYANRQLDLRFAVADARTVAETLRGAGQTLFREVSVSLLTDAAASREGILRALAAVAERARPEDTFVLYLAGHGLRTEPDRRFLFLPSDLSDVSSARAVRAQALEEDALVAALARIRARDGFLFVDTCHAGQLTVDSLAAIGNETGRFLLAASTSVQEALDSYDERNGVFAFAVNEGLRGRAATDSDGKVSALALGEYVTRRVPQLAAEKRHRQDAVFRTAQRDLRSFPLAAVAPR
jgi:hypothetical protein